MLTAVQRDSQLQPPDSAADTQRSARDDDDDNDSDNFARHPDIASVNHVFLREVRNRRAGWKTKKQPQTSMQYGRKGGHAAQQTERQNASQNQRAQPASNRQQPKYNDRNRRRPDSNRTQNQTTRNQEVVGKESQKQAANNQESTTAAAANPTTKTADSQPTSSQDKLASNLPPATKLSAVQKLQKLTRRTVCDSYSTLLHGVTYIHQYFLLTYFCAKNPYNFV